MGRFYLRLALRGLCWSRRWEGLLASDVQQVFVMRGPLFKDRRDAGRQLAAALRRYAHEIDLLVLALPRGGVPVAFEVAQTLEVPLDVFLVRKLGVPGHEELAMGALASGGVMVLNDEVVRITGATRELIEEVARRERRELERREAAYRGNRPRPEVRDKTVILVDDGLATGATMRAAVTALRKQQPARLIVGVPVAAPATCESLRSDVDEIVCARTPEPFYGVGAWYADFSQTTDREVRELLAKMDESIRSARR